MERYRTPTPFKVPVWEGQPNFYRADLKFLRVDHSGESYEARIFFGAPDATPATPLALEAGYAGSFYVFGHGPCFGDEGHCKVPPGPIHPFDYRPPHELNPKPMTVTVTAALQALIEAGGTEVDVTVVPTNAHDEEVGDILFFERLSLVTYD